MWAVFIRLKMRKAPHSALAHEAMRTYAHSVGKRSQEKSHSPAEHISVSIPRRQSVQLERSFQS
jgi:hypothetical protein